jgi:hypothetical protein
MNIIRTYWILPKCKSDETERNRPVLQEAWDPRDNHMQQPHDPDIGSIEWCSLIAEAMTGNRRQLMQELWLPKEYWGSLIWLIGGLGQVR